MLQPKNFLIVTVHRQQLPVLTYLLQKLPKDRQMMDVFQNTCVRRQRRALQMSPKMPSSSCDVHKVVCCECSHVSVTYEPFLYFLVPLPQALERQIVITYNIPNKGRHPICYLVNVKKHEHVKKIKEALLELIEDCPNEILAEVFENHISKILDDNTPVHHVNDISRNVYAFEIAQYSSRPSNDCSEDTAKSSEVVSSAQTSQTWDDATPTQTVENPTLTKCVSALAPSLSPNSSNAIALGCSSGTSGVACGDYSKSLQHPESELCDIGNLFGDSEIPESSRPSSLRTSENFGTVQWHSCAICLEDLADYNLMVHPNCQCILCKSCIEVSCKHCGGDSFICPGKNCSQCLFNQHCSGCEIARVGDIRLQPGDSLAVRYLDVGKETLVSIARVTDHKSMQQKRHKNTFNLYDCLEVFSERENLDENTWFCPECCQNQRAIKSPSVWRFPEVLIVCLKRFVFHDYTSIKLDEKVAFPLEGLDLCSYASGPISDDLIYHLQACVCHFGNLSSGHYTSYTKHAVTSEWYYYNDETGCKRVPKTNEDSMNEYILFYQKRFQAQDMGFRNQEDIKYRYRKRVHKRSRYRYCSNSMRIVPRKRDPEFIKMKYVPVEHPEVVLTVQIFRPQDSQPCNLYDVYDIERTSLRVQQQFQVLGCQYLTEVRDAICCHSGSTVVGELSEDPHSSSNKTFQEVYKSGFFYINGVFYNDMRDPQNKDYSRWVTTEDSRLCELPFFFCDKCFMAFNYDVEGNKIADFKAFKYIDRNILLS